MISTLSDCNLKTIEDNMREVINSKEKHPKMIRIIENIDVSDMIKQIFESLSNSEYTNNTKAMVRWYLESHIKREMTPKIFSMSDIKVLDDINIFFNLSQKCKDLRSKY